MKDLWNGRLDSYEEIDLRLWQVVQEIKEAQEAGGVCFVGYDTDDGVVRNLGRKGAESGSNAIRKAIQSFPQLKGLKVYDYRNLEKKSVEEAQKEYSEKMPVSVWLNCTKHIPDNLLLPINQFKWLASPCAFCMTQTFNKGNCIVRQFLVINGILRLEFGRLVLL